MNEQQWVFVITVRVRPADDAVLDRATVAALCAAGVALASCDCGGPVTAAVSASAGLWWLTLTCEKCGCSAACPNGRIGRRLHR